ncbi:hypothetical protein D3C72_1386560 [compost metagenome]
MVSGVIISFSDNTPRGSFSRKSEQEEIIPNTKNPVIYSTFFMFISLIVNYSDKLSPTVNVIGSGYPKAGLSGSTPVKSLASIINKFCPLT